MLVSWDSPLLTAPVEADVADQAAQVPRERADETGSGMDQAAFDAWAVAIRPRLTRLAYRFLWNRHDAEEIVQDALLLAWRRSDRLNDLARRNAWVFRATIHGSLNRRRRGWRRRERPVEGASQAEAPTSAQPEADELMACVRQAMALLPKRQHAVLVLREMEELSYEEIAGIQQTTPGAVRVTVHRARDALRRILLKNWPEAFGQQQ